MTEFFVSSRRITGLVVAAAVCLHYGSSTPMGRWPDSSRSTLVTFSLIFILFPLLALLCVWFMRS